MFGTLRYNKTTKNVEHIQLSGDDNVDARGHALVACDPCRAQKLKCNGDRNTCDRCLASQSKTCTYMERKRSGHMSTFSKRQRRQKTPDSAELKDLGVALSENSKRASTSWSDDSAISCGPSPSELQATVERQPLFTGSDSSWESINELIDTSNTCDAEMLICRGMDVFENLLASFPETTTTNTTSPDSQASLLHVTKASLCEPIWDLDSGLEPTEEQPQHANQVIQPQHAAYREVPTSQLAGNVIHQVYCNCLHTMTQLLEDTESTFESQGVDEFMMYLGRGTKMCESVLACIYCNACVDNAMLFTSNAQLLVATAQKISSKLLLSHQAGRRRSDSNKWEGYGVSETGDDLITYGRYRIEQPEMKARLVYQMVLLHIEDLQQLLAKIKRGVGMKRKAEALLIDAETHVAKLSRVIRELAR